MNSGSLAVPLVQPCALDCGLVAQASIVQVVRDAPDTKKVIPYCGDHLDVFCLTLVKEMLKIAVEEGLPPAPRVVEVLDELERRAQQRAVVRAKHGLRSADRRAFA